MASMDTSLKIKINKIDLGYDSQEHLNITKKDKLSNLTKNQTIQRKTYNFRLHSVKVKNFISNKKQKDLAKSQLLKTSKGLFELVTNLKKSDDLNISCGSEQPDLFWTSFMERLKTTFDKKAEHTSIKRKTDFKESRESEFTPKKKLKNSDQNCFIQNKGFVKDCLKNVAQPGMENENTQPSTKSSNSFTNSNLNDVFKATPAASSQPNDKSNFFNTNSEFTIPFHQQMINAFPNAYPIMNFNPQYSVACLPNINMNMMTMPQNFISYGNFINGNTNACIMTINSLPHIVISPFPTLSFYN